jgi:hypothetical protein
MKTNFEKFVAGYLECAAWADAPEDSNARFTNAAKREAADVCREFIEACGPLINQAAEVRDWSYLGRDFWLSRCGHGTGFWDREELTALQPCALVYGVERWGGGCFSIDAGDLGRALGDIAYGTHNAISRFAYPSLVAYRGWLEFS